MHEARLFHMLLPLSLGGGAADLVTFNQVIETLAAADASPAWCLAQAAGSSHAAGFLAPEIAREVFGAPDALVAWGPPAGVAKALAVDGGYRVTGKWRFASGSANATWMGGHSTVFDADDRPRLDAAGRSVNRTVLFRREHADIKDTWHVLGMRGTASNDYEVTDLFVHEPYSTWRDSVPDRREDGPLYNIPMLTLYGVGFSGVALGIARACLDAFMTIAQTKRSAGGVGSTGLLRENAVVQSRLAQATGQLRSARSFLLQMLAEIWETSSTVGRFSLEQRAHLRVAITGAMDQARAGDRLRLSRRRHQRDFPGRPVRAALPRHAHDPGAGPGASVEFRSRRPGAVRHRAKSEALNPTTSPRASGAAARRSARRLRA